MLKFSQVTPPTLSIAVICGGDSSERDISLQTGASIFDALSGLGHSCTLIDPLFTDIHAVNWLDHDVAAIAMHGRFGEDGQLQLLLEEHGIPFTGSDSHASKLAFSKIDSKQRFLQSGVPTPDYIAIKKTDSAQELTTEVQGIGYPVVVKPNAEGSSIGVNIVESPGELAAAMADCFQYGDTALIEQAIVGSEWTVAVIDDQPLPAICIEAKGEFYDFSAKYEDDATTYHFDKVAPALVQTIQATGLAACQSIGTSGVARADLRFDESNRPWVLEVNTIPGMTSHSLVPKAAAMAGISFAELCQRMVTGCINRHQADGRVRRRSA